MRVVPYTKNPLLKFGEVVVPSVKSEMVGVGLGARLGVVTGGQAIRVGSVEDVDKVCKGPSLAVLEGPSRAAWITCHQVLGDRSRVAARRRV